jgi:hypothetical protein
MEYSIPSITMQAGVMLEYSYDEAQTLLKENLSIAESKLVRKPATRAYLIGAAAAGMTHSFFLQAFNTEDLAFLRDQVITTEVNMARVFNFDVKSRRAATKAETIPAPS